MNISFEILLFLWVHEKFWICHCTWLIILPSLKPEELISIIWYEYLPIWTGLFVGGRGGWGESFIWVFWTGTWCTCSNAEIGGNGNLAGTGGWNAISTWKLSPFVCEYVTEVIILLLRWLAIQSWKRKRRSGLHRQLVSNDRPPYLH